MMPDHGNGSIQDELQAKIHPADLVTAILWHVSVHLMEFQQI